MSERTIKSHVVKEVRDLGDSWAFVTTDSTGFVRSKTDIGAPLQPGDGFDLETVNWSTITGLRVNGQWRFRLTDQDLEAEHEAMLEQIRRHRVEQLELNRKQWAQTEQDLPDWIRARITNFRTTGGENFLHAGWGYELVIAQLAVAYADGDTAGEELAAELGPTGNQVSMARALAAAHLAGDDEAIATSVSASMPITGSPDYR